MKDNLDLNPNYSLNLKKILVAFVAITPQYNSLRQRSKSNKVQATTYYIVRPRRNVYRKRVKGGYPRFLSYRRVWLLPKFHNEVSCVEVIGKDKMPLLPRAAVVLQAGLLTGLSLLMHFEVPDGSYLTPLLHPPNLC
jgi:hypothetical protein